MANVTKQASTRFSIVKRSKGQSAVEKASYISRSVLVSEYDGQTYRPKYHEDLVHSEISLPKNAPKEFVDRATLWNSVEQAEKGQKAQLARMIKVSLPNEWSYEVAKEVMRDYVEKNFVNKGMCADWAIHDSENNKGQRNLHAHIMLTMRPINEKGEWGAKTKKVYVFDENGERVPLIDRKTGQQKVDKQNRKQWKCQTIESTDWNSRENAGKWRKNLADTINATNEQLGIAIYWEHRSYAEQGIDNLPTIHLGSIASALERKGIQTERGNINRTIMARNKAVESARQMLSNANAKLFFASADKTKESVSEIKGEIAELIDRIIWRKGRLDLPIVKGKYLARVTDRSALQFGENAKRFISEKKISTFDNLAIFTESKEKEYVRMEQLALSKTQKIKRLQNLSEVYAEYTKYKDIYRQSQNMKGLSKLKYDHEHKAVLEAYPNMKECVQKLLKDGEKLSPKQWRAEIQTLQKEYAQVGKDMAVATMELAYAEVIRFNKKNLEREMENERQAKKRQRTIDKKREGKDSQSRGL